MNHSFIKTNVCLRITSSWLLLFHLGLTPLFALANSTNYRQHQLASQAESILKVIELQGQTATSSLNSSAMNSNFAILRKSLIEFQISHLELPENQYQSFESRYQDISTAELINLIKPQLEAAYLEIFIKNPLNGDPMRNSMIIELMRLNNIPALNFSKISYSLRLYKTEDLRIKIERARAGSNSCFRKLN